MMKTLNVNDFRSVFETMGRGNSFSYEGYEVLFDFLEDVSPNMELDVIGICCDFSELTINELKYNYGYLADERLDEEYTDEDFIDFLNDYTTVLQVTENSYIIQDF